MKPLERCSLYTFVDSACLGGRDPVVLAGQLCEGGADVIQLRAKDWPKERIERVAAQLWPVTRAYGVWLVINDHLEIAQRVGAEVCHLGQEDFFDAGHTHCSGLPAVPGLVQPVIGLSSHAPDQAERAVRAGAGYVAIGPVFATPTKPTAQPVTLEYVRWAAAHVPIPWFAIGGISLKNLDQVIAAGARRICVVSAILHNGDIRSACREFRARIPQLPA